MLGVDNTNTEFQSTLSMRRATRRAIVYCHKGRISIHALHEESDSHGLVGAFSRPISIHALHEESDSLPHQR